MFFALWPDDLSRQRCAGIIGSLKTGASRPVPLTNLHVTLVFLGNVSDEQQQALLGAAAEIAMPEIMLYFDRLSFWKKSGILCLTASEPVPEITKLAQDLTVAAKKLNIKLNDRPFKPHITLIREARKLSRLTFEPVVWNSSAFCLVQSVPNLQTNLGDYKIIRQWPEPGRG